MAMVEMFVFLLLRLATGDLAAMIAGRAATADREQLRLNDPMSIQFIHWVGDILRGDLGTSIFSGRPVLELMSQRLEPTFSLSILTMMLSVTVGISFGILAAWRTDGSSTASWRHFRYLVIPSRSLSSVISHITSSPSGHAGYRCRDMCRSMVARDRGSCTSSCPHWLFTGIPCAVCRLS